jgi:hypothetical protein
MIIIQNWVGRLGNNIIQLCNAIHIALYYKETIELPKHHFFNVNIIKEYFNNNKNNLLIKDNFNFYYKSKIKQISSDAFETNNEETINILLKAFIIKENDIKKLDDDTIVIHIRSGDIFNNNPHPGYIPPPLAYYVNILNNNKFNKIIIISEDTKNPVIDELLKLYPNSCYKKNSLEDDIKIILGATYIIESVGTFISSLLMLSNNIKQIYSTSMYNMKLINYYLLNKPWKNTKEQRDLIISYTF